MRRAARVLVPSGHARDELCALLGVAPERVLVTPEGVDAALRAAERRSRRAPADTDAFFRRLGIRRPYVLALGNLQPRKNLARLVEAWALLGRERRRRRPSPRRGRRLPRPPRRRARAGHRGGHRRPRRLPRLRRRGRPAGAVRRRRASSSSRRSTRASACRCSRPWPAARRSPARGRRPCPRSPAARPPSSTPRTRATSPPSSAPCSPTPSLRADLRARGLRRAASATWRACAELTAAAYDAAAAEAPR